MVQRAENNDIADYTVTIRAKTEKAVLVDNLEGKKVWLPISQCVTDDWSSVEKDDTVVVTIPDWLADKNGLR